MKRRHGLLGLIALCGAILSTASVPSLAQHGGGGGGGGTTTSTDTTTGGQVIRLSNFNRSYNGASAKGQVTLNYASDGSAQSMDFSLSQINVPDGTVLPVKVIAGVYGLIVSYYTYYGIVYTITPGTVTVYHKSVSLSLSRLKGDKIPDFPLPTLGTTEIQIYSPDGNIEILDGTLGKLRP